MVHPRAVLILTAAALMVALGSKELLTQAEAVVTVSIIGRTDAPIGLEGVELIAVAGGFDGPVEYSWSIESGPASIQGSGSSATVQAVSLGEVVVRVVAYTDASGSAEDTHTMTFQIEDGYMKPNDFNGDGSFDISDPVALLEHIFSGGAGSPCGDGRLGHPSNLHLFDANTSGEIDISDPVFMLNFLFLGGLTPLNCGVDPTCPCIVIDDCPDACS